MTGRDASGAALPRTTQVAQALRAAIEGGVYAPGAPLEPERALCQRFGASRTTIRGAIARLARDGLVETTPGSGTFVTAGASRATVATTIALGLVELANPWFAELSESIQGAAKRRGWALRLHVTNHDPEDERAFLQAIGRDPAVCGLLAVPVVGVDAVGATPYRALRAAGFPFVFVSHYLPGVEADYVVVDSRRGVYEATVALVELGHRAIVYLGVAPRADNVVSRWRQEGYTQAMAERGLDARCLDIEVGPELALDAARVLEVCLRAEPRPTAVVAFNDALAVTACKTIAHLGLRIPGDVSVTGFDNTELAAHWPTPLTSVDPSARRLGTLAVDALAYRLEHPTERGAQRLVLRPNLVIRQSCAPPPSGAASQRPVGAAAGGA